MSKLNPVGSKTTTKAVAGGKGAPAAQQTKEQTLRRLVMANLLWEDQAYIDGQSVSESIAKLIPQVAPATVAQIAIETREQQKLRHVPLFLAREMARYPEHKALVANVLERVCTRADMLGDFIALYWKDGKEPLSNQVKKGLARAFKKFGEYALKKYKRESAGITLRDVMFLVHPKADNEEQAELWRQLANKELEAGDTWEVNLSKGADKKQTWERLIFEGSLGAMAYLRNLRAMEQAGVDRALVQDGFARLNPGMLLPLNFFAAAKHAPQWRSEIEELMFRSYAGLQKLPGWSMFVVDVSGSMGMSISDRSEFKRHQAAAAMAVLAREACESVTVYATAGSDTRGLHRTERLDDRRGFALADLIDERKEDLGGGGIFTRQCLDFIKQDQPGRVPDRIIIFSDSQDCDRNCTLKPAPFGQHNYIVDVSAESHGINYEGLWTAEISGWSEHFLRFIMAMEGVNNEFEA